MLLSDWTDTDPEHLYRTLKTQSDYFNFGQRTAGDFLRDVRKQGWDAAIEDRRMWGEMRMNPTDLADVSGYAYTYLTNGVSPAGNWTGVFTPRREGSAADHQRLIDELLRRAYSRSRS